MTDVIGPTGIDDMARPPLGGLGHDQESGLARWAFVCRASSGGRAYERSAILGHQAAKGVGRLDTEFVAQQVAAQLVLPVRLSVVPLG